MSAVSHRPPRLQRVFQGIRPFYFVTFNTHGRQPILTHPGVHDAFCAFARKASDFGVTVGRYVIMPDHVHLFVALPEGGMNLATWVRVLRRSLGRVLQEQGHSKPHWQEGFFDHLLRASDSYSEKWNYVYMNPVRAGLADEPGSWPYQGEIFPIQF